MKKLLVTIFLLMFVLGCAATGVEVKQESLTELKKGETTIPEVVSKFGEPTTKTLNMDGTQTLMYAYYQSTVRPETFIPYIGGLVGGADTKVNSVILMFDKNGVLENFSASESKYGTGTGLASGTTINEDRTEQPQKAE